jgi:hypothetical protein
MKIYHLRIQDESDPDYDTDMFYTNSDESKTSADLENDYEKAYASVIDLDEWSLNDILGKIEYAGWKPFKVETAYVLY